MIPCCQEQGIQLLTYGTVCDGLFSEYYQRRRERGQCSLKTASQKKYRQMIYAWDDWKLFQELLGCLKLIADQHHVSIANVATFYFLDKPTVAGVIVGTRHGVSEHRDDKACTFSLALNDEAHGHMQAVLGKSRNVFQSIGDCGSEYRN